jgi:hypothetical protein
MPVIGQLHAPAALPPGEEPLHRRLGGSQTGLDAVEKRKFQTLAGNHTPAVQAVAGRYTDWAIPALDYYWIYSKYAAIDVSDATEMNSVKIRG